MNTVIIIYAVGIIAFASGLAVGWVISSKD